MNEQHFALRNEISHLKSPNATTEETFEQNVQFKVVEKQSIEMMMP